MSNLHGKRTVSFPRSGFTNQLRFVKFLSSCWTFDFRTERSAQSWHVSENSLW